MALLFAANQDVQAPAFSVSNTEQMYVVTAGITGGANSANANYYLLQDANKLQVLTTEANLVGLNGPLTKLVTSNASASGNTF